MEDRGQLTFVFQGEAMSEERLNGKVVPFQPRDDGEPVKESTDILGGADIDDIDLAGAENRAHAIRGALSTLDHIEISPEEFWAVFGDSAVIKASTLKWIANALEKLTAIQSKCNPGRMSRPTPLNVVSLSQAVAVKAEREAPEREADADKEPIFDMRQAETRAHAIRGAIGSIFSIDITGKAFWSVFAEPKTMRDSTHQWIAEGLRKLKLIDEEYRRRF